MRRLLFLLVGLLVLGLPAGASAAEGACPNEGLRVEQSATFLDDCRAYELVSPAEKGGVDVAATPQRTRAAVDGSAIQYLGLGGFGDARGTDAVGVEYIGERGVDGWSSHGVTPPQRPPVFPGSTSVYAGDFSEDLSSGVFFALTPLTSDPNVANVRNLYLRRDLLDAGAGSYELLSGCPGCESPLSRPPFNVFVGDPALAGASRDFSHVIFESPNNLTSDASGTGTKLYEWVDGVVRLAGILPDSACGSPPCPAETSVAGSGAFGGSGLLQFTRDTISEDGSRIVFTAGPLDQPDSALAANDIAGRAGVLYMREGGATSVQLNVSERSSPEAPQKAVFDAATPDDSEVVFATRENLTEDAAGGFSKLYMYDVDAASGHHLTLISRSYEPSESNGSYAVGISDDGHYVYFTNQSFISLIDGRVNHPTTATSRQLYVWHDGEIRYIDGAHDPGDMDSGHGWGEGGISGGKDAGVSRNGKTVVFATASPETAEAAGYDNQSEACSSHDSDCLELYVYNYDANRVVCVSCDSSGAAPLGDAGTAFPPEDATRLTRTSHLGRAVSADGGRVFFDSADPLVPQDVNGRMDVYEYDVASGTLHLISSGQSVSDSVFLDASVDGSDVFFATSQRLVRGDVDGNRDVYDARVGGGFAAQGTPLATGCEGDGCQGSLAAPVTLAGPASLGVSGVGNLLPSAPVVKVKAKAKPKKAKRKRKRSGRRRGKARRRHVSIKSAHRRAGR